MAHGGHRSSNRDPNYRMSEQRGHRDALDDAPGRVADSARLQPAADAVPREADVVVDDLLRELERLLGRHPPPGRTLVRDRIGSHGGNSIEPRVPEGGESPRW